MIIVVGVLAIPAHAGSPNPDEANTASISPLAVASNSNGSLEVFQASPNHGPVMHRRQNPSGGWTAWEKFSGYLSSVAAATNADGRVQLFGINDTGYLWTKYQLAPNGSTGWSDWSMVTSGLVAADGRITVAAASNADGRLELFYTDGGQTFARVQQQVNASTSWEPARLLPGTGNDTVAAQRNGDGLVELIGRTSGGQVQWRKQTAQNAATYTDWAPIGTGGGLAAEGARVTVGRNLDGRLAIAYLRNDGTVLLKEETTAGRNDWSAGIQFDGYLNSVALGRIDDGRLELFGTNSSGYFWFRAQSTANGRTGWAAWTLLTPLFVGEPTVCAISADSTAVYRYDGASWIRIGGPATQLYSGGFGLFARTPDGNITRYLGTPSSWQVIGGPGATWAVTGDAIYGLSPDRSGVWKWTGSGTTWTQVGGPAAMLYGGGLGLFATAPDGSSISNYLGSPFNWYNTGRPEWAPVINYVVINSAIYGLPVLSLDRLHGVWTASPGDVPAYNWQSSSGYADHGDWLIGGVAGVFLLNQHSGYLVGRNDLIAQNGSPFSMMYSGNPDWAFAVTYDSVYAATPAGDAIWRWTSQGKTWVQVGALAVKQIAPCL